MSRHRFFSDTSERAFLDRFPDAEFEDHCVEVETPEEIEFANRLGALEEFVQKDPHRTSGTDGFTDMGAFSTRSAAARMPSYTHPTETPFFNKPGQSPGGFPQRRKTRGQP